MCVLSVCRNCCSFCNVWWALVYSDKIFLGGAWWSGLAWPENEVRSSKLSWLASFLLVCQSFKPLHFLLWILQDEVERPVHVYSWVLYIFNLCTYLLGNKACWLWCFHGASCCHCHSYCSVLYRQVCFLTYTCHRCLSEVVNCARSYSKYALIYLLTVVRVTECSIDITM